MVAKEIIIVYTLLEEEGILGCIVPAISNRTRYITFNINKTISRICCRSTGYSSTWCCVNKKSRKSTMVLNN